MMIRHGKCKQAVPAIPLANFRVPVLLCTAALPTYKNRTQLNNEDYIADTLQVSCMSLRWRELW